MRAGIYCRISLDPTGKAAGVKRQEADCRQLAEEQGWTLAGVWTDNDRSATNGRKPREAYLDLIEHITAGDIDAIVVWHTDRLYRRPTELESLIDLVESGKLPGGVRTVVAGDLDLNTSSGRLVTRLLTSVAKAEVERSQERLAAMNRHAAAAGRRVGGRRPFGYELDGSERPSEAAEYRTLVDEVLAGASLRSLASDLNDRGLRTAGGGHWNTARIRDVLSNPRYAGLRTYRGEIVGEAEWDGLLDRETWELVQALLRDPARKTSPGNGRRHLLAGIARCAECGSQLASRTNHGKPAYGCRAAGEGGCGGVVIGAEALDGYVRDRLFAALDGDAFAAALAEVGGDVDTSALVADIEIREQRLDDLAVAFADGEITRSQLAAGTEKLQGEIDELRRRFPRPRTRMIDPTADVAATWDSGLEAQRLLVDALVKSLTVAKAERPGIHAVTADRVTIEWR